MKKAKKKPVKYQSGGAVKKKLPKDAIHKIGSKETHRSLADGRNCATPPFLVTSNI